MAWLSIKLLRTQTLRIGVSGSLDVNTLPEVEPMLERLAAGAADQVDLDLSQLRLIDTVGVGALIRFCKRLRASGSRIVFYGLNDQPLVVFRLLGLDQRMGCSS